MITILACLNASILLIISLLHGYWGVGGRWGLAQSLPTNTNGEKVLQPGIIACFAVAFALLAVSFYFLIYVKIINLPLTAFVENYGIWGIAAIFTVRAMGDFKYVGFSKKIKGTEFAELDTFFYSPLCLYLGITSIFIGLNFT